MDRPLMYTKVQPMKGPMYTKVQSENRGGLGEW